MALYEYICPSCGTHTDKRMPMSEALQLIPCPKCGKQAKKAIGGFAVVGIAQESFGDGPAPWDSDDGGDDDFGGMGGMARHGRRRRFRRPRPLAGPGGHTH